ncbi:MAG: abortive infection family protein, partial [Alistipes sp.]|nr:abortive infection family protein [Alistipes sp.]
RTLVEEVIIYILEQRNILVPTSGNLLELYRECKVTLGMIQDKSWDKRILEMLSGLEKIVNAICGMRNTNSDAHGVGSARIEIKEREARLIVNSSIILCEYVLDVFDSKK